MIFKYVLLKFTVCLGVLILGSSAFATTAIIGAIDDAELKQVQALLAAPKLQINFARAKLTIDQMVDPSMGLTTSIAKKDALRRYLYEAGNWNQFSTPNLKDCWIPPPYLNKFLLA